MPDTGVVEETSFYIKNHANIPFSLSSDLVNQIAFPLLDIPILQTRPEPSAGPEKLNPHLPMFIFKRHPVSLPCHHRRIIQRYNHCETGRSRELSNPPSLIYPTTISYGSIVQLGLAHAVLGSFYYSHPRSVLGSDASSMLVTF
jgi:hypothetical protein